MTGVLAMLNIHIFTNVPDVDDYAHAQAFERAFTKILKARNTNFQCHIWHKDNYQSFENWLIKPNLTNEKNLVIGLGDAGLALLKHLRQNKIFNTNAKWVWSGEHYMDDLAEHLPWLDGICLPLQKIHLIEAANKAKTSADQNEVKEKDETQRFPHVFSAMGVPNADIAKNIDDQYHIFEEQTKVPAHGPLSGLILGKLTPEYASRFADYLVKNTQGSLAIATHSNISKESLDAFLEVLTKHNRHYELCNENDMGTNPSYAILGFMRKEGTGDVYMTLDSTPLITTGFEALKDLPCASVVGVDTDNMSKTFADLAYEEGYMAHLTWDKTDNIYRLKPRKEIKTQKKSEQGDNETAAESLVRQILQVMAIDLGVPQSFTPSFTQQSAPSSTSRKKPKKCKQFCLIL